MSEEKAHKPTPKKLREARKKGKVLKSQLLSQVGALIVCPASFLLLLSLRWLEFNMLVKLIFNGGHTEPLEIAQQMGTFLVPTLLCALFLGAIAGLLIEGLQVGFEWHPQIKNPIDLEESFSKIFSSFRSIPELFLKIVVFLGLMLFLYCGIAYESVGQSLFLGGDEASLYPVISISLKLIAYVLIFFTGIAVFDYFLKRRSFLRENSMSLDELRRELKEDEGDPYIKSARRGMHRSLSYEEMVRSVRKAKVVVVERA